MRNFLSAVVVAAMLVPAVSFAGAPKKEAPAMKDAKAAPKTDAKADAKKDTKTATKTTAKTTSKKTAGAKKPAAK